MKLDFWMGLILAVPFAIIANLLTPMIQAWSGRWSKSWATRRKRGMSADLARVRKYKADKEILEGEIAFRILDGIYRLGLMIFGVLAIRYFQIEPFLIEHIASICIIIVSFQLFIPNLILRRDLRRLQNFEEYERSVVEAIQEDARNA